LFVVIR